MSSKNDLRRAFNGRFQVKQNRLAPTPGTLGNGLGVVNVAGRTNYVYVRIADTVEEVFCNRVPPENDLLVLVGYDAIQPEIYQVLSTRSYAPMGLTGGGVTGYAPAKRYQWMAPNGGEDPLWVELRQFLPLRIGVYNALYIQVYRGIVFTGTAFQLVDSQLFDMTPFIPTTTGQYAYVLITIDSTGTVIGTKGPEVTVDYLTMSTIQPPPDGTVEVLGAVRVYYGQTIIQETRTDTDIIDLRFTAGYGLGTGTGSGGSPTTFANRYYFRNEASDIGGNYVLGKAFTNTGFSLTQTPPVLTERSLGTFMGSHNATDWTIPAGEWIFSCRSNLAGTVAANAQSVRFYVYRHYESGANNLLFEVGQQSVTASGSYLTTTLTITQPEILIQANTRLMIDVVVYDGIFAPIAITAYFDPTGTDTLPYTFVDIPGASAGVYGTVTEVDAGTGLTGGPITSTGTIALADTTVTPGSYTGANITVDAQGRITAASSGSGSSAQIIIASAAGAALNTNLSSGGGTDDTTVLQTALNTASGGAPLLLIMDGPALVSGLNIYSNTTILCLDGAGFYLKNGSNRSILRNANRSGTTRTDHDITLMGGYYNGNYANQTGSGSPATYESDGTPMSGVQFYGVSNLTIKGVEIVNTLSYMFSLANVIYVDGSDIKATTTNTGGLGANTTDGFNVNGPSQYITLRGLKIKAWDDSVAFNTLGTSNAGALGPYIEAGAISDVVVDGLELMGSLNGVRLFSTDFRIDRVIISNVTGSAKMYAGVIDYFNVPYGDFGSITLDNWDVSMLSISGLTPVDPAYINFNGVFESLTLRNIKLSNPVDTRPLLWFHSGTSADLVVIDQMTLYDPSNVITEPILVDGGTITRLVGQVIWYRPSGAINPVTTASGGTVTSNELNNSVSVSDTTTIDLTLTSGTLTAALKNTTVTPGSYTNSNVTIDAQGRVTSASNGSGAAGSRYRAWLYSVSGGNLTILTAPDGTPLTGLLDLEV